MVEEPTFLLPSQGLEGSVYQGLVVPLPLLSLVCAFLQNESFLRLLFASNPSVPHSQGFWHKGQAVQQGGDCRE